MWRLPRLKYLILNGPGKRNLNKLTPGPASWKHARSQNCLPAEQMTAPEQLKKVKGVHDDVAVFSPEEMTTILHRVRRLLSALGTKAAEDPKHRFRSLARLLDRQMLGEAFGL